MSRAKFEEFVKQNLGDVPVMDNGRYISPKIQNYWQAWLAGRESMRDEAASQWEDCFYESVGETINICEAIRRIKP